MNKKQYQKEIKCPICGKIRKVRSDTPSDRLCLSCACKQKPRRPRKMVCSFCGSPKIYDHGKSYRIKACKRCFDKWQKRRNRKEIKCPICGEIKKIYIRMAISEHKKIPCRKCTSLIKKKKKIRIYYLRFCEQCGSSFHTFKRNQRFCSKSCVGKNNVKYTKSYKIHIMRLKGVCVDCGESLKGINHKSKTHPVCDFCMNVRRRKYKDRIVYGNKWKEVQKTRDIILLTKIGEKTMKGDKTWQQKPRIIKKLDRLGLRV